MSNAKSLKLMVHVTVQPLDLTIECRREETLRDALHRHSIHVESPCNGQGSCGSCRVWVLDPGAVRQTPHESISEAEAREGCRLSCQLKPERDMTVRLPMNFLRDARRFREEQNILEGEIAPTSRLVSAVKLRSTENGPEMAYDNLVERTALRDWKRGYEPKGLALDLGTTTLVVTLVSLQTGRVLATASRLNPQIRFGHDVMTRIQHGSTREGLGELSAAIREGVGELVDEVCQDSDSVPAEILDAVAGGNTTMLQLIAGMDPAALGQIPFTVGIRSGISYPAHRFGLRANEAARVYVPPVLHAFIGSDISAGLLIHSNFFDDTKTVLFVDVGTNGEIALNVRGRRLACSAAAGPAFEGMGISCGMRASIGAVESVAIKGSEVAISTVGHAPVRGICGSGIVDLVAVLLRLKVLDATGRFSNPLPQDLSEGVRSRIEERHGETVFSLDGEAAFTQRDIRQVQLAKGAIRAGIEVLLSEAGSSVEELDSIVIAGGFGFFLNPENLEIIGLIPSGTKDRVKFAGNACRSGCVWLLTDISYRRFLEENMERIEHVSIAQSASFMDVYVQSMEFREHGE